MLTRAAPRGLAEAFLRAGSSALTVAEIRRAALEKPTGKKRDQPRRWFPRPAGPQALFAGHVLPFDEKAGLARGRLVAEGRRGGRAALST